MYDQCSAIVREAILRGWVLSFPKLFSNNFFVFFFFCGKRKNSCSLKLIVAYCNSVELLFFFTKHGYKVSKHGYQVSCTVMCACFAVLVVIVCCAVCALLHAGAVCVPTIDFELF